MTESDYIDVEASLGKGKIITLGKKNFYYYFDLIVNVFAFSVFSLCLFGLSFESVQNPKLADKIFAVLCFLAALISVYAVYRKFTENNLIKLNNLITRSRTKKILLEYFKDPEDRIVVDNGNFLIIEKQIFYYQKIYRFIIKDNILYFNIINRYPKTNPPVIIDHFFLKRDLNRLFDPK